MRDRDSPNLKLGKTDNHRVSQGGYLVVNFSELVSYVPSGMSCQIRQVYDSTGRPKFLASKKS